MTYRLIRRTGTPDGSSDLVGWCAFGIPSSGFFTIGLIPLTTGTFAAFESSRNGPGLPDCFLQLVLFIGLARMLALAAGDEIDLAAAISSVRAFLPHAEQDQFGDVAEIEADTAPVRPSVLPILCQTDSEIVLYQPQAAMTCRPSGSAFGTQQTR